MFPQRCVILEGLLLGHCQWHRFCRDTARVRVKGKPELSRQIGQKGQVIQWHGCCSSTEEHGDGTLWGWCDTQEVMSLWWGGKSWWGKSGLLHQKPVMWAGTETFILGSILVDGQLLQQFAARVQKVSLTVSCVEIPSAKCQSLWQLPFWKALVSDALFWRGFPKVNNLRCAISAKQNCHSTIKNRRKTAGNCACTCMYDQQFLRMLHNHFTSDSMSKHTRSISRVPSKFPHAETKKTRNQKFGFMSFDQRVYAHQLRIGLHPKLGGRITIHFNESSFAQFGTNANSWSVE